ncbi:MAG TPA: HAD family hydrolase [Acidimicrobiales bacterium]|nr:HAD family hydrolase [Acidimicrobiales bacterium]
MRPVALFDLDNTLVDRQGAWRRWSETFTAELGLGLGAVELLERLDGDGFAPREHVFAGLREHYGLACSVQELIARYRASYPACFAPDPAVDDALRALRGAGWLVGVVTNGPPSQVEKLRRTGLDLLVDGWWISEVVGVAKPDRRIFDLAVEDLRGGRAPRHPPDRPPIGAASGWRGATWMVGDSPLHDVAGARGAGLRTVWMHRGRRWALDGLRPDAQAGSIPEAVARVLEAA